MSTAPVSQLSWISSYLDLLPGLYNEFNDISRVKFLNKGKLPVHCITQYWVYITAVSKTCELGALQH